MKKEISEENRILLFSLRREQVGKNRNKMKKSNEHFFQLYNEKGEVVGSLGDLLKRLEEARISVKEMSDEVAQESFNTVSNIYDQPTADEALPIFEGLQYLHICDFSKIFLPYEFVFSSVGGVVVGPVEEPQPQGFKFFKMFSF